MSAIGPTDHEEFCRRDAWEAAAGKGHDKWQKRLADDRLLRTVIHRHTDEYGSDLKSRVLAQLEVDEPTFWQVIQTRKPATRPTPTMPKASTPLADWIVRALEKGRLNQAEIASLSADEAERLAVTYFSTPPETASAEVRERLLVELDRYRGADSDESQ